MKIVTQTKIYNEQSAKQSTIAMSLWDLLPEHLQELIVEFRDTAEREEQEKKRQELLRHRWLFVNSFWCGQLVNLIFYTYVFSLK